VDPDLIVRDETPADRDAVLDVLAAAFVDEPEVVGLWRELRDVAGTRSLVAVLDGAVVGHVGLTPGWIDAPDRVVTVRVLSPLSVRPEHQRTGVGGRLVESVCALADELGSPAVFLEGDPGYYGRHGFLPGREHGFAAPSERIPGGAFQVRLLPAYDASVTGALVYPDVFWRHDAVGLRGEDLERFRRR
jgi:putative acetyltransferase